MLLPEYIDPNYENPPVAPKEEIVWELLSRDEQELLIAIRERGIPKWMQRSMERYKAKMEREAKEKK